MMSSSTVNAISHTTLIILYEWFISIKKSHLTLADGHDLQNLLPTPDGEYWRTQVVEGSHGWPPTPPIHHWRHQTTTWVNHWDLKSHVKWCTIYHFVVKENSTAFFKNRRRQDVELVFFPDSISKMICFFFVWGTKKHLCLDRSIYWGYLCARLSGHWYFVHPVSLAWIGYYSTTFVTGPKSFTKISKTSILL